jgi:ABC-type polysaccharide/polyol phosphate export permease
MQTSLTVQAVPTPSCSETSQIVSSQWCHGNASKRDRFQEALRDLRGGLARWELWGYLGWVDIRRRYRRSAFGPIWLTANAVIFNLSLGFLYPAILGVQVQSYLPMLAVGGFLWQVMSSYASEASTAFISSEPFLRHMYVERSLFIYLALWRQTILALHVLPIPLAIALFCGVGPTWAMFFAIPALAIWLILGFFFGLLLAMVSTRFRDMVQIVGTAFQLGFFVTPVLWTEESLASRRWIAQINPLHHLLEILRAPILGRVPAAESWAVAIAVTVVVSTVSVVAFAMKRAKLPFWL